LAVALEISDAALKEIAGGSTRNQSKPWATNQRMEIDARRRTVPTTERLQEIRDAYGRIEWHTLPEPLAFVRAEV
jgi:hypothetical protein